MAIKPTNSLETEEDRPRSTLKDESFLGERKKSTTVKSKKSAKSLKSGDHSEAKASLKDGTAQLS